MTPSWTAAALALALASGTAAAAQTPVSALAPPLPAPGTQNPHTGNPLSVLSGQGQYRQRCANCHGMDARGHRGPDLTTLWTAGRTDAGIFQTIRMGVPGTEMPAAIRAPDDDVWRVIAYLRTLAAPAPAENARGDATRGERIFRAQCASCHRVNGRGGRIGPDLSRIGLTRARTALTRQLRGANEDISPGYEPVTLQTTGGQTIRGVRKNEDLASIQIMDTRERIQGYLKEDLRDVVNEKRSMMPVYGPEQLSEGELDDLLRYMETLRGPVQK